VLESVKNHLAIYLPQETMEGVKVNYESTKSKAKRKDVKKLERDGSVQ